LVEKPLFVFCGYHACDLGWCGLSLGGELTKFRYKGRVIRLGYTEILVPGDEVVYRAPSLILHYIPGHRYLLPNALSKLYSTAQNQVHKSIPLQSRGFRQSWLLFLGHDPLGRRSQPTNRCLIQHEQRHFSNFRLRFSYLITPVTQFL
jgi:hypothetical protein